MIQNKNVDNLEKAKGGGGLTSQVFDSHDRQTGARGGKDNTSGKARRDVYRLTKIRSHLETCQDQRSSTLAAAGQT